MSSPTAPTTPNPPPGQPPKPGTNPPPELPAVSPADSITKAIVQKIRETKISGHAVAGFIVAAAALVVSDQSFRNNVLSFFDKHPDIGTMLVSLAGLITTYTSYKKKQ